MNTNDKDSHAHTLPEANQEIPIFTKLYEFYKSLSVVIPSFPKTKRYSLGLKIDNITLEIIELLFYVPISANKTLTLQKMSVKLDLLKVLIRLSKDSQAMNNSNYLKLQVSLQEIGKMLGGWLRASKQKSP